MTGGGGWQARATGTRKAEGLCRRLLEIGGGSLRARSMSLSGKRCAVLVLGGAGTVVSTDATQQRGGQ